MQLKYLLDVARSISELCSAFNALLCEIDVKELNRFVGRFCLLLQMMIEHAPHREIGLTNSKSRRWFLNKQVEREAGSLE